MLNYSHRFSAQSMYRSLLFDDIECDRKARFVIGLNFFMHLSEWHPFNPRDRQTYPKVDAPVQAKVRERKTQRRL
jgi:hypothetical protein